MEPHGEDRFTKDLTHLRLPSAKEVVPVEVPEMNYLMIDGEGDPNTSTAYQAAVKALFTLSCSIKFIADAGCALTGKHLEIAHCDVASATSLMNA